MVVSDVMTREVFAVAPDTSIETAARLLASKHITGAPVVNTSGRPVGVVSLTDLVDPDRPRGQRSGYPLFYHIAHGETVEMGDALNPEDGSVADVMSPFVLSIEASATLAEAANRIIAEGVHRLLVMDGNEVVGIVSAIDLLRGFARTTAA
jgi:CBS domain-containing protein